jgi:hypothetical protein
MPNYTDKDSRENLEQEQQAKELLNDLLSFAPADRILEDISHIFMGYLASSGSDDRDDRQKHSETHYRLVQYFTKIGKLSLINRFQ